MQTVFSKIVQEWLPNQYENVATDALAFILESPKPAGNGMMKLIHELASDMPTLQFETQQNQGNVILDMVGYDKAKSRESRVFVENKFEAGLTPNQPVEYLKLLAKCTQPTVLLFVVPETREQTLWRELDDKLKDAGISSSEQPIPDNIVHNATTNIGPILALTSWRKLLSALEEEMTNDPSAKNDLLQLRALCDAADGDAFEPISSEQVSDLRTPALILQLNSVVNASVDLAIAEGVLITRGNSYQGSADRIGGRNAIFYSDERGVGIWFWFGIDYTLWKKHGRTPFWLLFWQSEYGRALEVWSLLEPWSVQKDIPTFQDNSFVVAVDLTFGKDKAQVVRGIVDRLKEIKQVLSPLAQKPTSPV